MPSVKDLERLNVLLQRLNHIGQAQRGELILAEDWNGLVESVSDLARALLGQQEAEQVPAHTHLDQVSVDWLVPVLRDQLQRGPLADPAMQSRLFAIEQQLRSISQQIDGQRTVVDGVRGRLTDVVTRDLVRETAVTNVSRQVTALGDARSEVLDLRRSIGSVQKDLGSVLEAAQKLQVNGQPVDIGTLAGRVNSLEGFRRGFVAANGQELDATSIEQRLAEVSNQFVTKGELDGAVRGGVGNLSPDVLAGIEDRVGATVRNQVNASFDGLAVQIRGEMQDKLSGVGDLVGSRLNDALPGVAQTVTASLTPAIEKGRQDAITAAVAQAVEKLAASEKGIRADLTKLSSDLKSSFATTVKEQMAASLPGELSGLRADLAALTTKADSLGTRTGSLEASVVKQGDAVASLQQDAGRQRLELRDLLQSEIKQAVDAQTREINARFTTIQTDLRTQIDSISKDIRQQAVDSAKAAAMELAQSEARNTRTQIIAEMRQVAREEAGILVRDLKTNTTVTGGNTRLNPISPVLNP